MTNPFLTEWDTPHGMPPFAEISVEDYEEAFEQAFAQRLQEIEVIASATDAPSFENTIEAMERSGQLLERVAGVFFNLTSSDTSEQLQAVETRIMPDYAAHFSEIFTNQALFQRVRSVQEGADALQTDQRRLVIDIYTRFVRAGAALEVDARQSVKQIDEELATLETQFGQSVLNDTNDFELVLDDADELSGLPDSVLQVAAAEAESRDRAGHVFTISRSSITPFLQFAERRDLREKIYRAYTRCADNDNANNNREVLAGIAALRARRAKLLGFESHAHFMLDDRMAKTPENVNELLDAVWRPARARLEEEASDLQDAIQADGGNFKLEPWDWWYYTEKIRNERFDLDEEDVKPYFRLENVRAGAFAVATRLFGISFEVTEDVPLYHEDVTAYEVKDRDGSLIGLFLTDYFMRPSKRGGAWMSGFRDQSNMDEPIYPIVVNCCNFPKGDASSGQVSLLGMDEVRTLFHEFGHALHGLLSRVRYPGQSGTSVKQDFVELPSQIMEHWAIEPEVLRSYATHYQTGAVIPDELIAKLQAANTFNQGFATSEYLAACYLDMAWHTLAEDEPQDVEKLETRTTERIGLPDAVDPRYKSTYFQHIFSGDSYSAGYYAYIWAEVLDADGYGAFTEAGIFDQQTAGSFRKNILERGGSEDPMTLYRLFRGRDPEVEPLLKDRGLV